MLGTQIRLMYSINYVHIFEGLFFYRMALLSVQRYIRIVGKNDNDNNNKIDIQTVFYPLHG